MSGPLDEIRGQITANDKLIIAAVNERLRLVTALWELKQKVGVDQIDPQRELDLRAELAAANAGPLSPAGLERLITELLALTKSELA
jgi:chorismate mutase